MLCGCVRVCVRAQKVSECIHQIKSDRLFCGPNVYKSMCTYVYHQQAEKRVTYVRLTEEEEEEVL